jgi:hypothetical protein
MFIQMNQHQIKNKVVEKIIGVIVLFVAVAAVVTAGYFYVKSQNSRSWPAAEGVITKSSTRIQRNPGDSGAPATIADVWYSYVVDGIEHHNDTISHAQYGSSSARHAVQEARRYPVDSRVLVYYNPESGEPHPVSTYSKTKTSLPCGESLKAEVAQRQKIDLDDGIHALYVTATLCIEEEEMKAASQSHLTWPTIAGHLVAYDKAVFDPESTLLGSGEENATEAFVMRLKRIENESLQRLHENGIFFVKAIQFDYLQVFKAD